MEYKECDFNDKGEIVCKQARTSAEVDDSPVISYNKEFTLDLSSPPSKKSEGPSVEDEVV